MDSRYGFARMTIPAKDPEQEMEEKLKLLTITRAGSALGAQYAQETIKKDPTIADKARKGYLK